MELSLRDFLAQYGQSLKARVIDGLAPVFNPNDKDQWDREAELKLETLKRKPFAAQAKAVLAIAKGFSVQDKRGIVLTAEMGTGKTICSIAVAHLLPKRNYRVIVMCPGHLVQKWIREIEITVPKCAVRNLNGKGIADIERLRHARKPVCPEFYVIGKERAKNHHQWKKAYVRQRHLDRILCPCCGKDLDAIKSKRPKCPDCGEPLYEADKNGMRRFAKSEYAKKYLKGKFDLFVADEVHELKGGTTAQGQAFANFACVAKRTLGLTGTLMGGYSTNLFYIFWRLMSRAMKKKNIPFNSPMRFAEDYGIIERTIIEKKADEYNDASIGRNRSQRTIVKEKPGVSPLVLTDFLLDHSVFMRLADVSKQLPPYEEKVVEVEMTPVQRQAYQKLRDELYDALRDALRNGDHSLLGAFVNSLLAYPDGSRRGENVIHPHKNYLVASAPPVFEDLLPKEVELLNILQVEASQGRKCLVLLEHTGTRDLIPDLSQRIEEKGFKPLILRSSTVSTEKREEWVKLKMKWGAYDLMICNPNLIKTGLDLIEFPTIIFFQTGYSIFTLRQASRRSWRIGQTAPVRVYYLAYNETMQSVALSLIATKLETALAIEGDLSDRGLAVLAEGSTSMLIAMARSLLGDSQTESVSDAWKNYKQKEINSDSFIEDIPEVETTTTTIEKGDRSSTISYQRVVRGRIYPRNGYALAYVGSHRFTLRKGQVFFNNTVCGTYDKKGYGKINDKLIQVIKSDRPYYLLVELKAAD